MSEFVTANNIIHGDCREVLKCIESNTIACSIWSPPYHVGKDYEAGISYADWQALLDSVITGHQRILKPGGFLAINIADILAFKDENIPKIMADVVSGKKVKITREQVLAAMQAHPDYNRYQLAKLLGCSEQTIDRRLNGNNIRGGKYAAQTRVKLVGGMLEEMALKAGLYLYDRRVWVKDPAWQNSRWHTNSYRAVDEFEYVYIFWKPGITVINRDRLTKQEWIEWGSRGVWFIPSVRANDDHEAKFPLELPRRIIQLLTEPNDIVLDCFLGSGTTAVAAIQAGRRYIGIELHAPYVEMARLACKRELEKRQLPFVEWGTRSKTDNERMRVGLRKSFPGRTRRATQGLRQVVRLIQQHSVTNSSANGNGSHPQPNEEPPAYITQPLFDENFFESE